MTLSRNLSQKAGALRFEQLPQEAIDKVKIALLDFLSCAYESLDLAPSVQAIEIAGRAKGCAGVIGSSVRTAPAEAAFANAVLGHGLVREDMHTGSVSHLGVVVFPTLLALADRKRATGREFIRAAVCGYEVAAAVGRAVMDKETVRKHRPTGTVGPLGAAAAGALLLGLNEDATTSAIGMAANTASGLNEWPASGADEMFFHVGFAARSAVTCVDLAELGAYASETALDGEAGLFAALGRRDRSGEVHAFEPGYPFEIMAVYHKPAPACNYAQTACQVARLLVAEDGVKAEDVEGIHVRASAAALNYPGCNATGPYQRVLQAKMSIQYCVAATLLRGEIEETNYRLLKDPDVLRLVGLTKLEEGAEFTRAYPGLQGTEVTVKLRGGKTVRRHLNDVVPATEAQIRARFKKACANVLNATAANAIETAVAKLEDLADAGALGDLLGLPAGDREHETAASR